MKAVILESYVMEEGDLDWSGVKALVPDTVSYVRTAYEEIAPRIGDADIVLLNKCRMDEEILQQCPNLKWVGIIATGTDNLDLEACQKQGEKDAELGRRAKEHQPRLFQQRAKIDHGTDADEEQQREQLVGHARFKQCRDGADRIPLRDGT